MAYLPKVFLPSKIEKFRSVFFLTFLFLVVTIIFTPLFVRRGFSFLSEEILEAVLLLIQVSVAWHVFRLYEKAVSSREKEIRHLEEEYQKREKELLETFTYLGKVNVQISMIKSFLQKMKVPANKKELKEYIDEVLHMALSTSKKEWMTLRVIHPEKFQTLSEYWAKSSIKVSTDEVKIGNKEIVDLTKDKRHCNEAGYCVLSSSGGSASSGQKAFLVFLNNEEIDHDVLDFLKAAVNQCEIIYTLFTLKHGHK
jgi:hypothetical protein